MSQEEQQLSWAEEERAMSFDDIIGLEHIINQIKVFLATKKVINILLVGPPGTCKTSVARIIARKFLGKDASSDTIHEFNASDVRGIDFVRNEIKPIVGNAGRDVIILDEGEYLTKPTPKNDGGAQPALRRLAEEANRRGKIMIITCNDTENIIEAILSRFLILTLPRNHPDIVAEKIKSILDKRGIDYSDELTKAFVGQVVMSANGDMRVAINNIEWNVLDNELIVNPNLLLFRDAIEKFRNTIDKTVTYGDFMGLREDVRSLLYEDQFGMTTHQMIRSAEEWLADKHQAGEIVEDQYARCFQLIKECDDNLTRQSSSYVQIVGMIVGFRLFVLR